MNKAEMDEKQLNVMIPGDLKKELGVLARRTDTPIKTIVTQALNAYIEGRIILK